MKNADPQQSFTATLSINNKPVALAQKVIQKKRNDPEASHSQLIQYHKEIEDTFNLLTFDEGVTPESFFFAYSDGVYVIKIKGSDGNYSNTVSMEGELRNWMVFEGTDPTFFRIKDRQKTTLTLSSMPDDLNEIFLYSGPQHREVCTYDAPPITIITDYPNRGGQRATFELKIIKRYSDNGH